jgi:hypothetical protein
MYVMNVSMGNGSKSPIILAGGGYSASPTGRFIDWKQPLTNTGCDNRILCLCWIFYACTHLRMWVYDLGMVAEKRSCPAKEFGPFNAYPITALS